MASNCNSQGPGAPKVGGEEDTGALAVGSVFATQNDVVDVMNGNKRDFTFSLSIREDTKHTTSKPIQIRSNLIGSIHPAHYREVL